MTIHDKTEQRDWQVDMERWDSGDVVIGYGFPDFPTMYVVYEIDLDQLKHVIHRGMFWRKDEAKRYAEELHQRTPLLVGRRDEPED